MPYGTDIVLHVQLQVPELIQTLLDVLPQHQVSLQSLHVVLAMDYIVVNVFLVQQHLPDLMPMQLLVRQLVHQLFKS
jgi:hypothetical protein